MSQDKDNRAIIREYLHQLWDAGRPDLGELADRFIAPGFVGRTVGMPVVEGRDGYKRMLTMVTAAFPNAEFTVEDLIAEGDRVVVRWSLRATHRRDLMGIAATGRRVEMTGAIIYRMAGGQVQEWWEHQDLLGMLQQLGALPAPPAEATPSAD